MAKSYIGLFIPSSSLLIKNSIKELWNNSNVEIINSPFEGIAIYNLSFKYDNPYNLDNFKHENPKLLNRIIKLSLLHPYESIVLIEEHEHGDISSYQGFVMKNGEFLINEMGNFDFVIEKFRKKFELKETNWWSFYENRLNILTSPLNINKENFNLFERYYNY